MTCSPGTPRDVRGWLVVCSAVVALGCGAELKPSAVGNALPAGVPTDTAAYDRLVAQWRISGTVHHGQRKIKSWKFWERIDVTIAARGNTYEIDPHNPSTTPIPVAHLVNLDKKEVEKYYGLLPGDQAEYDLWVNKKTDKTSEWRIVERSKTANSVLAGEVVDFDYCHVYKPGGPKVSDADFAADRSAGKCTYRRPPAPTASKASILSTGIFGSLVAHVSSFLAELSTTDGGWIYCANGCCT